MTLDEAIKHAEEVAIEQDKLCKRYDDASGYSRSHNEAIRTTEAKRCEKCAKEHLQLAAWLEDYQRLLEEQLVDDAKKHFEIICKLSQACGMPYSFVEEKIRETEKALLKALPQEPCEDAISRENTLKAMIEQLGIRNEDYLLPAEATLYKVVKNMPPVTPQLKMQEVEE